MLFRPAQQSSIPLCHKVGAKMGNFGVSMFFQQSVVFVEMHLSFKKALVNFFGWELSYASVPVASSMF